MNEVERAEAEEDVKRDVAEMLEDVAPAAKRPKHGEAQKEATRQKVQRALAKARRENPGQKELIIDLAAAEIAGVSKKTIERYKRKIVPHG